MILLIYLNDDSANRLNELRFIFDFGDELLPLPLYLSKTTIFASLQALIAEPTFQGRKIALDARSFSDTLREVQSEIEPLISLTLYVCTQTSEILDFDEKRPPLNYNRKRKRIFPPESPLVRDFGVRMGAAIRKARAQQEQPSDLSEIGRHRPRPHIRRAHWHGYWQGSKQGKQEFQLKWLPPIAVNVAEDSRIIPTVKRLK